MASLIRGNRGQSVVEFALVLPLLLMIVFGITEFGRAWMTANILTSAAREGARLAVVTGPDKDAVTARVTAVCAAAGVTPSSITVEGPDPGDPNRRVTVTVSADFSILAGTILTYYDDSSTLKGTFPLSATSVMRHESI